MKVSITGCRQCGLYRDAGIFELCASKASEYTRDGVVELHTCQHMRLHQCGPDMRFRVAKEMAA